MLRCRFPLSLFPAFALALLLTTAGYGSEAPANPSLTVYGTVNPAAPKELAQFAFLVGKWSGTGKSRTAEGKYAQYKIEWIGRYILDGMAIADEGHSPDMMNGAVAGISFRYFDPATKTWTIEFLNFARSFLRKQVSARVGSVTSDGKRVVITQAGDLGGVAREVYTLTDPNHFTYSLDTSQKNDNTWDEGLVTMTLERQQ